MGVFSDLMMELKGLCDGDDRLRFDVRIEDLIEARNANAGKADAWHVSVEGAATVVHAYGASGEQALKHLVEVMKEKR
jgi:hypothetical protein